MACCKVFCWPHVLLMSYPILDWTHAKWTLRSKMAAFMGCLPGPAEMYIARVWRVAGK